MVGFMETVRRGALDLLFFEDVDLAIGGIEDWKAVGRVGEVRVGEVVAYAARGPVDRLYDSVRGALERQGFVLDNGCWTYRSI